jgi:TolB-like protein
VSAAAPIVLTRKDSLAIAEAVQDRLAREEAIRGREQLALLADSITAHVRRAAIDSILRANIPAGVAIPAWRDIAPPPEWGGKRRVVVTEPGNVRARNLEGFGRDLSDSISQALNRHGGMKIVDRDSVKAAVGVSRARGDLEASLHPDLLITPTFVGVGDTMTVIVTVRDSRSGKLVDTRVASGKFAVSNPEAAIPGLVKGVVDQVESLTHMPSFSRVLMLKPSSVPAPRPKN